MSWMDDWTSRGLVGAPLLLKNMASTTAFIVARAPRGCKKKKYRASARLPRLADASPQRSGKFFVLLGQGRYLRNGFQRYESLHDFIETR
jgi:hypothetical protein